MSLSEIGLRYNYTVTVLDRLKAASSPFTCGNERSTVVSSTDLDFLFVLAVIGAIIVIPTMLVTLELIRHKRCDGYSYAYEWEYEKLVEESAEADGAALSLLPDEEALAEPED
jgi:hypothetical protein